MHAGTELNLIQSSQAISKCSSLLLCTFKSSRYFCDILVFQITKRLQIKQNKTDKKQVKINKTKPDVEYPGFRGFLLAISQSNLNRVT